VPSLPSARRPRRAAPVAEAPRAFGLLLTFREAALYLGVSETRLRDVRELAGAAFPAPVQLPGANPLDLYRREDVEAWVRSLRPVERQRSGVRAA
jgi:hypothetical protein